MILREEERLKLIEALENDVHDSLDLLYGRGPSHINLLTLVEEVKAINWLKEQGTD